MSKTAMVLGGSGNLGYYLVNELAKKSNNLIIADISNPWYVMPEKTTYEMVDALNINSIEDALKKYRVKEVIHLIGLPITSVCQNDPEKSFKLNVLTVQATLEAMRKTGVNRIIFASAGIAYGIPKKIPVTEETPLNPHTVYGAHKAAAEYLIKAYSTLGIEYVILRLFSVISDDIERGHTVVTTFIEKAAKKEPLTVEGEKQARDFIYAGDAAKAFAKATEITDLENQVINISSGKPTRIIEIAQTIKKQFPETEIQIKKTNQEYTIYADNTKMKTLLGIEPEDPLKAIERIAKKYREKAYRRRTKENFPIRKTN